MTHRLVSFVGVLSAAVVAACSAAQTPETEANVETTSQAVSIQKSYTRKIYAHMMPWFVVGGQHWSMNSRNSATGIASWYSPMIGEYSSDDGNVIEYQLLMMKYAGIDGVLVDWDGLNGANDLPRNKSNADAIINKTAQFGLEFGIVYEDQYAVSVDAAKNDLSYARDNFFNKSNYIQVDSAPALLVFGPQKITNPSDWDNIMTVFSAKPRLFPLWYNDNAGGNAYGRFAWLAQNGMTGVLNFDMASDGANEGVRIPVLYPGFNTYYAQGGWPGPTWKLEYTLKPDNTLGGDTLTSTFQLGEYAGPFLQIATWNDYGEGTMIEPTNQFQYQFLTTLQTLVGATYTDAELKIVKMLFDQRRGGGNQAQLDQASTALANLDVASACKILGCTAPVHTGGGSGGAPSTGGSPASGGSPGAAGTTGVAGAHTGTGGTLGAGGQPSTSAGHPGTGGTPAAGGSATSHAGAASQAGSSSTAASSNTDDDSGSSGGCSVSAAGGNRAGSSIALFTALALGLAGFRRRSRDARAAS